MISWMLKQERNMNLNTFKPYNRFKERVFRHRDDLLKLLNKLKNNGKKVFGYGASTEGNVLLQFCNISTDLISYICDNNSDKFGCYTPGSNIPIISEKEAKAMNPDYFLVLPWHYKRIILENEKEFIASGGKLIFPLPEIEIF